MFKIKKPAFRRLCVYYNFENLLEFWENIKYKIEAQCYEKCYNNPHRYGKQNFIFLPFFRDVDFTIDSRK